LFIKIPWGISRIKSLDLPVMRGEGRQSVKKKSLDCRAFACLRGENQSWAS